MLGRSSKKSQPPENERAHEEFEWPEQTFTSDNQVSVSRAGPDVPALITRSLAGDEQAFATLAEMHGTLLLRTAYLMTRDEEAAKDIVQESLLLAWKNLEKLREPAFFRTWLLKIVVNQSTSLKRQWARKAALLREQFTQSYVDQITLNADLQKGMLEDRLDVAEAIDRLPVDQRAVVILFYYHRMTMPEIATVLGVAENTLRKRLQIAIGKIRKYLRVEVHTAKQKLASQDTVPTRINSNSRGAR